MKSFGRFTLAFLPFIGLVACGGGNDLQDRLDVADPAVRFVNASPFTPNLTLFRETAPQSDANNTPFSFADDYFDIDTGNATWNVNTATGNVPIGSVPIDPVRGDLYTIIALATSPTTSTVALIVDPFDKPLTSQSTRLRLFNAAFDTTSVDVYMSVPGTDINTPGATPLIAATAFDTAGPPSGSDSVSLPGGNYTLTITIAGTKTILFTGALNFGNNQDLLLLTLPDGATGISVFEKVEGVAGAAQLPPAAS
jgi:Domain of unknown function (DUF4397)